MSGKNEKQTSRQPPDPSDARVQALTTAMNERLIVSSIHQQELREVAERLNVQLKSEIADRL